MDGENLDVTIGLLLAAGGPLRFPVIATFAVHAAVLELSLDASSSWERPLTTELAPDIGLAVHGVAEGLYALLQDGVLATELEEGMPCFVTDADRLRGARRNLMGLAPATAASYRRVGLAWRARCSRLANTNRSSVPCDVGAATS